MTSPLRASEPDGIEWRYTFCDLRTRTRLARLPLVDADLSEVIGAPAEGGGSVPVMSPKIRALDPWTATTPRRTCVFAQRVRSRGGRVVASPALWAGIVWKRERSGRSLKLTLATAESYYARRLIARDRVFSWVDDGAILGTLFADAEAVPGGSLGLAYDAATIGTRSDRTVVAADLKSVLATAQSVATGGGGFDWRLTPRGQGTPADPFGWRLERAARMGRANVPQLLWTSKPDGRPGNELIGYTLVEDGSSVPNELTGLGSGQPPEQIRSVATAAQLGNDELTNGWPLLQTALAASSTGDLITQAAVDRHTRAELQALRAVEVQVTGMTVRGDRGPTVDTYGLGDVVTLKLRDPLHREPRTIPSRIVGRRILPGQPGRNETVTMTLQPVT